MSKYVYFFGDGKADGRTDMKELLGGKGANLAEMTNLGVPVPPGFTIACSLCITYLREHQTPESLRAELEAALQRLERVTGRTFGDAQNPLLVSVRSGSPVSMPGMMETILNLGLNDETVEGLDFPLEHARSVQFHPEAGPGPHDAWPLIDQWVEEVAYAEAA